MDKALASAGGKGMAAAGGGWPLRPGLTTHHLLTGQGRVPGEEEGARLLVQGDKHGPVRGPSLRPAHEADDALIAQARLGGTRGSILVHQAQDLVHVGQLLAGLAHADPGLSEAGPCVWEEEGGVRESVVKFPETLP